MAALSENRGKSTRVQNHATLHQPWVYGSSNATTILLFCSQIHWVWLRNRQSWWSYNFQWKFNGSCCIWLRSCQICRDLIDRENLATFGEETNISVEMAKFNGGYQSNWLESDFLTKTCTQLMLVEFSQQRFVVDCHLGRIQVQISSDWTIFLGWITVGHPY